MNFNWVNPKVVVGESATGSGQFATTLLVRGELIAVFGGRVMTLEQFHDLTSELQHFPYQIHEAPDLLFGPMTSEDIGSGDFFKHSCEPNAGFHGTLELVAMRPIEAGEEITFDYALCMSGTFGDMDCQCGAAECRGRVTGADWQLPLLRVKYAGYWQPFIQRKITNQSPPTRTNGLSGD